VIVLGATGRSTAAPAPLDDWIHTRRDQGALVRPTPNGTTSRHRPVRPGKHCPRLSDRVHAPCGPVYINLDATSGGALTTPPRAGRSSVTRRRRRGRPPTRSSRPPCCSPAPTAVDPRGRVSRNPRPGSAASSSRTAGARSAPTSRPRRVPTDHPLHAIGRARSWPRRAKRLLEATSSSARLGRPRRALRTAAPGAPITAKVIRVSVDQHNHNGWSMDHQGLAPPMSTC